MAATVTSAGAVSPKSLDDVPGFFAALDQVVFTWLLEEQERQGMRGDLVELGAYMGKSAILIGRHVRAGETFTVCDLFEGDAPDSANQREQTGLYSTLTRSGFEANYLAFHPELPTIVQAPTSVILDHVRPASCRFVHIDASHMYNHVAPDISAANVMLATGGIVACDDYRTEHTPGVAAAVWESILTGGLQPICVTRQKLYGIWGDPAAAQAQLRAWLATQTQLWHEVQHVAGRPLVRIREASRSEQTAGRQELEHKRVFGELVTSERQLAATRRQLAALQRSRSLRIGRAITAPARRLRALLGR